MRWPRYTLRQLLLAVAVIAVGLAWWQGTYRSQKVHQTGRELDFAIMGQGFFEIKDWHGQTFYTRNGHFLLNANGAFGDGAIVDGRILQPQITIPQDWTKIQVSEYGTVTVQQAGSGIAPQVGQLLLTRFMNPDGLTEIRPGMFLQTLDSGTPQVSVPGQAGLGYVQQGWLENVEDTASSRLSSSEVLLVAVLAILIWLCIRITLLERRLIALQVIARDLQPVQEFPETAHHE